MFLHDYRCWAESYTTFDSTDLCQMKIYPLHANMQMQVHFRKVKRIIVWGVQKQFAAISGRSGVSSYRRRPPILHHFQKGKKVDQQAGKRMKARKAKPTVRYSFHLTVSWNCLCLAAGAQTQSRMKSPENGKISVVPATFILLAYMLIMLCGQSANHLNPGCLQHKILIMDWDISNVFMEQSQCLLRPCSSLGMMHGCAEVRASGRCTWFPLVGLASAVLKGGHRLWQGAEGRTSSHRNPALEQSDELQSIYS